MSSSSSNFGDSSAPLSYSFAIPRKCEDDFLAEAVFRLTLPANVTRACANVDGNIARVSAENVVHRVRVLDGGNAIEEDYDGHALKLLSCYDTRATAYADPQPYTVTPLDRMYEIVIPLLCTCTCTSARSLASSHEEDSVTVEVTLTHALRGWLNVSQHPAACRVVGHYVDRRCNDSLVPYAKWKKTSLPAQVKVVDAPRRDCITFAWRNDGARAIRDVAFTVRRMDDSRYGARDNVNVNANEIDSVVVSASRRDPSQSQSHIMTLDGTAARCSVPSLYYGAAPQPGCYFFTFDCTPADPFSCTNTLELGRAEELTLALTTKRPGTYEVHVLLRERH